MRKTLVSASYGDFDLLDSHELRQVFRRTLVFFEAELENLLQILSKLVQRCSLCVSAWDSWHEPNV